MTFTRVEVSTEARAPMGTTNAYLLGDDRTLLLDPGGEDDGLDELLADRTADHLAVTHHHPDHVGGVATYAERTDATVWARRGRERAFEAATGVAPDRAFREDTVIDTDDGPVRVVETPGHAPEHVAFRHASGLAAGDLAVGSGSVVVGAPEGDVRAYLTSLRRVYASNPPRLYPGHGPVVDDARATCRRLIAHRLDREQRVCAAVRDGARTVAEVVDAAYEKDVSDVRDLAAATVRAHLDKLAVEGAVEWTGDRVRPA